MPEPVTHGWFSSGLIASVLGTKVPGPGTVYLEQTLRFLKPVAVGDQIIATITVRGKDFSNIPDPVRLRLLQPGQRKGGRRQRLGSRAARENARAPDGIAGCATEPPSTVPRLARAHRRFTPFDHGDRPSLRCQRDRRGNRSGEGRIDRAHSGGAEGQIGLPPWRPKSTSRRTAWWTHPIARPGRRRGRAGDARRSSLLMKGSLHTDELLHAVLAPESELRTGRRLSHVYLFDVPGYPRRCLSPMRPSISLPDWRRSATSFRMRSIWRTSWASQRPGWHCFPRSRRSTPSCNRHWMPQHCAKWRNAARSGRLAGRPARLRQRRQPRGGGGKRHRLAGRRPGRHPAGSQSGGRQHAGEATVSWRAPTRQASYWAPASRSFSPAGRTGKNPHGVLRRCHVDRPCGEPGDHDRRHPDAQCRLFKPEIRLFEIDPNSGLRPVRAGRSKTSDCLPHFVAGRPRAKAWRTKAGPAPALSMR